MTSPQAPLKVGNTEVAFLVLRKNRLFYELRCRMGRGLPGKERRQEN